MRMSLRAVEAAFRQLARPVTFHARGRRACCRLAVSPLSDVPPQGQTNSDVRAPRGVPPGLSRVDFR